MKVKDPIQAEVNIGIIGHVDHGKTTLVEKLSGKWADTHSEEIKRGISIKLGYADAVFRKCETCGKYTIKEKCECGKKTIISRKVSFVDAPGHETLMATMLSGSALMDGAILLIAANEPCPQPRTIEHLIALKIQGTKNLVVAQNKIDLVSKEEAMKNYKAIKKFLKEQEFENTPIIPISATFNINIDLLIKAIEENIPTPKRDLKKNLVMLVVRSFDVNLPGIKPKELQGGVLGGSIIQGIIKIGDEIEIGPGIEGKKINSKVISLSTKTGKLKKGVPGGLIAVGTLLDPSLTKGDQMRGQVIGLKNKLPKAKNNAELKINYFERLIDSFDEKEIQKGEQLILTIMSGTFLATVKEIKENKIKVSIKPSAIIFKEKKIAVSRKGKSGWRLAGYAEEI